MTLSMRPTPELHQNPLRIAVGIATSGRAAILHEMLSELRSQTVPVFRIVISFDTQADIEGLSSGPDLLLLPGPKSLVEKRNRILDAVEDCDVVLFLDDDFLLAPTYVEATAASFTDANDIVVTTGRVIADGIIGPGLSVAAGRALLAQPSCMPGQIARRFPMAMAATWRSASRSFASTRCGSTRGCRSMAGSRISISRVASGGMGAWSR